MSGEYRPPASEIIREVEVVLRRADAERERAAMMLERAEELQQEAYEMAVKALGQDIGSNAYQLACLGLNVNPDKRRPASSTSLLQKQNPVLSSPIAEQPSEQAVGQATTPLNSISAPEPDKPSDHPVGPVAIVPVRQPARSKPVDQSKHVFFGVEVKRSKLSEAEDVMELARKTAAQNRKSNPYEGDRGRNAWRNHLFQAALTAEEKKKLSNVVVSEVNGTDDGTKEVTPSAKVDSQAPVNTVPHISNAATAKPEISEPDISDPFDDPVVEQSTPTKIHQPTPFARPSSFSRAVPITRAPVETTSDDQETSSTDTSETENKSVTEPEIKKETSLPEIHVDRPVSGRIFAHGQASPMPAGLSEALKNKTSPFKPAPISTPRPSISKPAFLKNRK